MPGTMPPSRHAPQIELVQQPTNRFTISDYIDIDDEPTSPLNPSPSPSSSSAPAPSNSRSFTSPRAPFTSEPTPRSPPPLYSTDSDPFFSFSNPPSSFSASTERLNAQRPARVLVSPEPTAAPVVTVTSPTPATASRPAFFRDRSDRSSRSDNSTAPLVTPFPPPPPSESSSDMRSPESAHPPLHSIATNYLGRGPEPQRVSLPLTPSPEAAGCRARQSQYTLLTC